MDLEAEHLADEDEDHFCQNAYGFFQVQEWLKGSKTYCGPNHDPFSDRPEMFPIRKGRHTRRDLGEGPPVGDEEGDGNGGRLSLEEMERLLRVVALDDRDVSFGKDFHGNNLTTLDPGTWKKAEEIESEGPEEEEQEEEDGERGERRKRERRTDLDLGLRGNPQQASTVRCYQNSHGHNSGRDVFCEIDYVMLRRQSPHVVANCEMTGQARAQMGSFPSFMYGTGLGNSLRLFSAAPSTATCTNEMGVTNVALVQRDGDANLFHMYAEFFGFFLSTVVLGLDRRDTQVVLLDDRADGYEFAVWEALTGRRALRPRDVPDMSCARRGVYTIPGGSSPLWRGSWAAFGCSDSRLFHQFTSEISHYYQLPPVSPQQEKGVFAITVIARRRRVLTNTAELLGAVKAMMAERNILADRFPISVQYFEDLSYADQLRRVRDTTILVGLHGAGLTHLMFLPAEAVVVEVKPRDFGSFLFRNMAKLCGKGYFSVPARETFGSTVALDFNYSVDPKAFVDVILAAIMTATNFGSSAGFSV